METVVPITTSDTWQLPVVGPARDRGVDPRAAEKVGQDFESVFLSMMLSHMRNTLDTETLFPGDKSDVYGGMFDMFLGQHLAQSSRLGIGDMVKTYLESMPGQSKPVPGGKP